MRTTWLVLLVLCAAASLGTGEEAGEALVPVVVGQPAPDFTLVDHEDEVHELSAYRGSAVALGFFDVRNGYCDDILPGLQGLWNAHPDLIVLAVDNSPDGGTVEELKEIEKELKTSFPLLRGGLEVAARYGFLKVPGAVFIDAEGVVRARVENLISEPFVEAVGELLAD